MARDKFKALRLLEKYSGSYIKRNPKTREWWIITATDKQIEMKGRIEPILEYLLNFDNNDEFWYYKLYRPILNII
ncbi:MAG: hypothetical protein ACHQF4_02300 [Sphingobacteriales bacterium]|jgi:hypothetical protein